MKNEKKNPLAAALLIALLAGAPTAFAQNNDADAAAATAAADNDPDRMGDPEDDGFDDWGLLGLLGLLGLIPRKQRDVHVHRDTHTNTTGSSRP